MGSTTLGLWRFALYLSLTILLIPAQTVAVALRLPVRDRLPRFYHRLCCRIIGLRLTVRGPISRAKPTLFVSNHSSYLDIMVLGALIRGGFVAKAEVRSWPLFGLLARLQRSVFVNRRTNHASRHRDSLQSRLMAGDNLILFPEGTSSDGNHTLPFKSALFAAAALHVDGGAVAVQPVSITATALDGIPLRRALRPYYAWYGDMDLLPHLWEVLRLGDLTVTVQFHDPVSVDRVPSRKALAEHCWQVVAAGVAAANAGRSFENGTTPAHA